MTTTKNEGTDWQGAYMELLRFMEKRATELQRMADNHFYLCQSGEGDAFSMSRFIEKDTAASELRTAIAYGRGYAGIK